MDAALSPPGPGRFAAADAVVQADPSIEDRERHPVAATRRRPRQALRRRCRRHLVRRRRVGRQGRRLSGDPLHAHGWASAPLTPYRLISGRAPAGPHEVVLDERLAAGDRVRIATPVGESTYRVTGRVRGSAAPTLFFADRVAARLSGAPDQVNAIVIRGTCRASRRRSRCSTASTRPMPTPVTRAAPTGPRSSPSSGPWAASPASSRCSSWPGRSRSRSSSAAARSP